MAPGENGNGLISYMRYNTWLVKKELESLMGKPYTQEKVDLLNEMDHAENCEELFAISSRSAEKEIQPEHFPDSFIVR